MAQPKTKTRLLFADSERDSDLRYLSGFNAPDPFLLLEHKGKRIGVFSRLELGRALKQSACDQCLPLEELTERAQAQGGDLLAIAKVVCLLAKDLGVSTFSVPETFPAGVFQQLQMLGLSIEVHSGDFVPERLVKDEQQAKAIARGNRAAAAGLRAAEKALKAATIDGCKLKLDGKPLTSQRLRMLVDIACLEHGAQAANTICAGGEQACDPHHVGVGPLRANELIIVDVFPRHSATGYHGDMTRTFLKGRASEAQRALVEAVRLAQFAALQKVKPGVEARTVHQAAASALKDQGFETRQVKGTWEGFFHSTGHGLGLDIHEAPRISPAKGQRLRSGMVFTVEPGLYYPGLGGCRIEDVVQVTGHGYEPLSKYPYKWELR